MSAVIEVVGVEMRGSFVLRGFPRDPASIVVCVKCGRTTQVHMEELATNPEIVPEHCGEPMAVPSLDEVTPWR